MKQEHYFTPISQLLPKSKLARWIFIFLLSIMSLHSIYTTLFSGRGLDHYERHMAVMEQRTMFYNPWQYRIMTPLVVEGVYLSLDATIFKLLDFKALSSKIAAINLDEKDSVTVELLINAKNPEYIKYLVVFVLVRWLMNMLLFALVFIYWSHFSYNKYLLYFSLLFFSLVLGNSVNDCDFSFNTVMDVIIYLLAGLLILRQWNPVWLMVIAAVGSFNRETSIMIPGLYFLTQINYRQLWEEKFSYIFKELKQPILWTGLSYVAFFIVFAGLRWYFGYVPQEDWRVPAGLPMLKLNLFSAVSLKSYFEMYGTFMFLPLLIFIKPKEYSKHLFTLYIAMVPIWISIHLFLVVAYQSRLFLVPTVLVLFPMALELIEKHNKLPQG